MGVLINWAEPLKNARWTKFCIERSINGTDYIEIARINAKDNKGKWITEYYDSIGSSTYFYRVRGYDEVNDVYGDYSEELKADDYKTYYCTVSDVLRFLQLDNFSMNVKPNIADIVKIIRRKEDEIDFITGHSWRERKSGTVSINSKNQMWEYYSVITKRKIGTGYPIKLRHRSIRDFDYEKGDRFEVWNGSSYENWLSKDNDRAKYWWLDNLNGILYITGGINPLISNSVRLKYRYGEDVVPGDITDACILLTACDILYSDDRSVLLPEGVSNIPYVDKVERWKRRANEILSRRVEWRVGL